MYLLTYRGIKHNHINLVRSALCSSLLPLFVGGEGRQSSGPLLFRSYSECANQNQQRRRLLVPPRYDTSNDGLNSLEGLNAARETKSPNRPLLFRALDLQVPKHITTLFEAIIAPRHG